jgi:hypothetical protein
MHLMNDVRKLDKGTFIAIALKLIIKSKTQSIPIISCSTRTIKGILNKKGNKTDFVLTNVAMVKDFLINIVLKALLIKIRI